MYPFYMGFYQYVRQKWYQKSANRPKSGSVSNDWLPKPGTSRKHDVIKFFLSEIIGFIDIIILDKLALIQCLEHILVWGNLWRIPLCFRAIIWCYNLCSRYHWYLYPPASTYYFFPCFSMRGSPIWKGEVGVLVIWGSPKFIWWID